jgi:hypothetical protein
MTGRQPHARWSWLPAAAVTAALAAVLLITAYLF